MAGIRGDGNSGIFFGLGFPFKSETLTLPLASVFIHLKTMVILPVFTAQMRCKPARGSGINVRLFIVLNRTGQGISNGRV